MYTLLTQCFIRRRLDYRGEVSPDVNLNWFDDSVALEKELKSKVLTRRVFEEFLIGLLGRLVKIIT